MFIITEEDGAIVCMCGGKWVSHSSHLCILRLGHCTVGCNLCSEITFSSKGMGIQIDRDVNVWCNKTYLSKPLLVKEDRLILEHRRWYSQFYSESSKKFTFVKDKDISW